MACTWYSDTTPWCVGPTASNRAASPTRSSDTCNGVDMTCKTASTMHYLKRQLLPVISIFALPQGNYNCLTDRVLYALVSLDLVDLHIHGTVG